MRPAGPPTPIRNALPRLALLPGVLLAAFLLVPLLALLVMAAPDELAAGFSDPAVWPALRLSLLTTTVSLVVVVVGGLPLAWTLSQARGRMARVLRPVETALQLPIVMPPAVAGVALLLAYGRRGWLGAHLPEGWHIGFTTLAVILAEIFVSAPFFLQTATAAFRSLDPELLSVARALGASRSRVFFRVVLPLAARGLAAGAAMSWARALGELGATLMFAGNLQGVTQTAPLAVYTALESDFWAAQAMALVLVVVAFGVLLLVRALARRGGLGDVGEVPRG